MHVKRQFFLTLFFLLISFFSKSQYIFKDSILPDKIFIGKYSSLASSGQSNIPKENLLSSIQKLSFKKINTENENVGFTKEHYWLTFSLFNPTLKPVEYYLETARPVTDNVDLYTTVGNIIINTQHSGDAIPFQLRSFEHRKTIFVIQIPPGKSYTYIMHLKSDGEVLLLPLVLRSAANLLNITYLEQLVFGFFYGILILAAIIYLFFYFGMKDKSFLNYSLYVIFIALMQFSLDGYFYQYVTPSAGWFSLHAVLIFASIAAFFLGRYSELFLNIPKYIPVLSKCFTIIYYLIGISFLLLVFVPSYFSMAYPIINLFGMIILLLIITSVIYLYIKRFPVDLFFTTGILFLIAGFVLFILNNFNFIPITFLSQNSSKLGTGMEVIFISLSMANRIRKLREEREHLILDLTESNHDLKQFNYITSHNLRGPVSNLEGLISLYDRNDHSNERNKMIINKIEDSTKKLNETIADLTQILHIKNSTDIPLGIVNFEESMNRVKKLLTTEISKVNVTIHQNFNHVHTVLFNEAYLDNIFYSLLSNSIKFKLPHKALEINIRSQIKNNEVQVLFSDNGSGINLKKNADKIFGLHQKFNTDIEGRGVGLYIIKTQITSLGGKISADSEEGKGVNFTINFKKGS